MPSTRPLEDLSPTTCRQQRTENNSIFDILDDSDDDEDNDNIRSDRTLYVSPVDKLLQSKQEIARKKKNSG